VPSIESKEKKKVLACARPIFYIQDSFFLNYFLAHVTTVGGGDAQLARAIDFNKLSASLLLFF
jgi:hypothetical protein